MKVTLVAAGDILQKQNVGSGTVSKAKTRLVNAKVELLTNLCFTDTASSEIVLQ